LRDGDHFIVNTSDRLLAQYLFGDLMNVSASLGSLAGAVWQPFLGQQ
jgi:hypothetical protein